MKPSREGRGSLVVAVVFALSMGCMAPADGDQADQDDVRAVVPHQAMVNGTPVSNDAVGTPLLHNSFVNDSCTSTLLRDRWLITAYHCVSQNGDLKSLVVDPSYISATVGSSNATAVEIHFMADPGSVPNVDVALVKLGSSLPAPSGHAEPWELPIYSGSMSSLVGRSYYCQGWGFNSCTAQVMALRSATLKVDHIDTGNAERFVVYPNSSGQLPTNGDSGSACYQVANGRYNVVGIDSFGQCGSFATYQGAESFRDWASSVMDRVGVVDGNGLFSIKEGGLTHNWSTQISGAFLAAIAGPRVAMIRQSDGHCLVKEGALSAGWVDQWSAGGVVRCLLDGSRIGIITKDGVFRVKDGSISSTGWVVQTSNAGSAVLSGNRIGYVSFANGHFYVKEGALNANWVDEYANVRQGLLSGTRIGVVTNGGELRVKEGGLSASWVVQSQNVTQAALSGNRVGALLGNGHFYVKEGALTATWVDQYSNVVQGSLSGKRIGVVANNPFNGIPVYSFMVKEGDLNAGWVLQVSGSSTGYTSVLPNK